MKSSADCSKLLLRGLPQPAVPGTSWVPSPQRPQAPLAEQAPKLVLSSCPPMSLSSRSVAEPARTQAPDTDELPASCQSCFSGKACCVLLLRPGTGRGGQWAPTGLAPPHRPPASESCPFCILHVPLTFPSLLSAAGLVQTSPSFLLTSFPGLTIPTPQPWRGLPKGKSDSALVPLAPVHASPHPDLVPWVTGPGNAAWSLRNVEPLSLCPFPFQARGDFPLKLG